MSRELILLRHGKSDWSQDVDDRQRPLKKRGRRDAERVGRWLHAQGFEPQRILTSPAVRARDTARIVAEALGDRDLVEEVPSLYAADPEALRGVLTALPEGLQRVVLVGHNPGLEWLAEWLLGAPLPATAEGKRLTTAALVWLTLPDAWSELGKGSARLRHFLRPAELADDRAPS